MTGLRHISSLTNDMWPSHAGRSWIGSFLLLLTLFARVASADTYVAWAGSQWKYAVVARDAQQDFSMPSFDDAAWSAGSAPFGSSDCGWPAPAATTWPANTDLLARMRLRLECPREDLIISVAIDNRVRIWVNGIDVSSGPRDSGGCARRDTFVFVVPVQTLIAGDNIIAVRASDFGGSAYFDASITSSLSTLTATPNYVPVPAWNVAPVTFRAATYGGFSCPQGVSYQWQRRNPAVADASSGAAWIDLADGSDYAGCQTDSLTVIAPNENFAVPHRCVIAASCLCPGGTTVARATSNQVSFGLASNAVGWGSNDYGQLGTPGGVVFDQIVTTNGSTLGLRPDGTLVAWGARTSVPAGRFLSIAGGWEAFMAIREDGTAQGFGDSYHCAICPPSGTFRKVVPAFAGGIGIRTDGTLVSWGSSGIYTSNVPQGRFVDLVADGTCYAIREDGVALHFDARVGTPPPVELFPGTRFVSVCMGSGFAVLLAEDGTLRSDGNGAGAAVPGGVYRSIAAGVDFGAAIAMDGTLVRWGNVRGPAPTPPPGGFRRVSAGTYSDVAYALSTEPCSAAGSIVVTSNPTSVMVSPSGFARFTVAASGPMPLSYRWRRNGVSLVDGARVSGSSSPTLTLSGVVSGDQGVFDCIVTDACRRVVSATAELSCRPVMLVQPQGAIIAMGQSVPIDVAVSGSPTSLQWRKDGTPLIDSTSYSGTSTRTLWITGNDPNQSGWYELTATNACGVTTSVKALIMVSGQAADACPGDFNGDGGVDGQDLFDFFDHWQQGC